MTRLQPRAQGALASIAVVLSTLTACGGKVVVDGHSGAGGSEGTVASSSGGVTASSSTGGTPDEEATCTSFCAIVAKKGCPHGGDCQARCVGMFVVPCVQEIKDTLDCTASLVDPGLGSACVVNYPDTSQDCGNTVDSALQCLLNVAGFDCPGFEESTEGDGSCHAKGTCNIGNLLMTCDPEGTCTCVAEGQVVGTCKNLLLGSGFCSVTRGCCAPLFAKK